MPTAGYQIAQANPYGGVLESGYPGLENLPGG